MALRIYAAPNGSTFQYEEGEQPDGFTLADVQSVETAKPKATPRKRRTTTNKAAKPDNK